MNQHVLDDSKWSKQFDQKCRQNYLWSNISSTKNSTQVTCYWSFQSLFHLQWFVNCKKVYVGKMKKVIRDQLGSLKVLKKRVKAKKWRESLNNNPARMQQVLFFIFPWFIWNAYMQSHLQFTALITRFHQIKRL